MNLFLCIEYALFMWPSLSERGHYIWYFFETILPFKPNPVQQNHTAALIRYDYVTKMFLGRVNLNNNQSINWDKKFCSFFTCFNWSTLNPQNWMGDFYYKLRLQEHHTFSLNKEDQDYCLSLTLESFISIVSWISCFFRSNNHSLQDLYNPV